MKRELAFALGVQSQLASPLGRTRSSQAWSESPTELSQCNGGPESDDVSSKRLKVSPLIVYTRRGKIRNGVSGDLKVEQIEKGEEGLEALPCDSREGEIVTANGAIEEQCNGILDKSLSEVEHKIDEDGLVEVIVKEDLGRPHERDGFCGAPGFDSEEGFVDVLVQEDASLRLGSLGFTGEVDAVFLGGTSGSSRRLTRPLVEEEIAANDVVDEVTTNVGEKAEEVASQDNLQVTTSGRKIVLNKKLMTVRDLFETGLLDGVIVVYMAGVNKVDVISLCTLS